VLALVVAGTAQARVCNQSPQPICDQRFDAAVYATTHNSFAATELSFIAANQNFWLTRQLDDGVRAFMLDVYNYEDLFHGLPADVYLCHGFCPLGSRLLSDALQDLKDFLDTHPDEVISIIFESYVHIDDLVSRFAAVGLDAYLHVQTVGQPWPTLNEMIDANRRLVVFSDRVDAPRPGYHYVWSHAVETHFSAGAPWDLSCNRNRGSDANPLFILNHFLTQASGSAALASLVNFNPFLLGRAIECWAARAHLPNFVTVDFYDIGDVITVVDELNRNRLDSATPPPTYTPTPTPTPFACASAPDSACLTPARAKLRIAGKAADPKVTFQWNGSVAAGDVGDPSASTNLAVCLYVDGAAVQRLDPQIGAYWRKTSSEGVARRFKLDRKGGAPDGIDKMVLQMGAMPRGRISFHARGTHLALPVAITTVAAESTLTVQLIVQDGAACWSAHFSGDAVRIR